MLNVNLHRRKNLSLVLIAAVALCLMWPVQLHAAGTGKLGEELRKKKKEYTAGIEVFDKAVFDTGYPTSLIRASDVGEPFILNEDKGSRTFTVAWPLSFTMDTDMFYNTILPTFQSALDSVAISKTNPVSCKYRNIEAENRGRMENFQGMDIHYPHKLWNTECLTDILEQYGETAAITTEKSVIVVLDVSRSSLGNRKFVFYSVPYDNMADSNMVRTDTCRAIILDCDSMKAMSWAIKEPPVFHISAFDEQDELVTEFDHIFFDQQFYSYLLYSAPMEVKKRIPKDVPNVKLNNVGIFQASIYVQALGESITVFIVTPAIGYVSGILGSTISTDISTFKTILTYKIDENDADAIESIKKFSIEPISLKSKSSQNSNIAEDQLQQGEDE